MRRVIGVAWRALGKLQHGVRAWAGGDGDVGNAGGACCGRRCRVRTPAAGGTRKTQKMTSGSRRSFSCARRAGGRSPTSGRCSWRRRSQAISWRAPESGAACWAGVGCSGRRRSMLLVAAHASSLRWRPVRRTNTSSRLAWRVVRCSSLAPLLRDRFEQRGNGHVRLADVESRRVHRLARTASTPGSARQDVEAVCGRLQWPLTWRIRPRVAAQALDQIGEACPRR